MHDTQTTIYTTEVTKPKKRGILPNGFEQWFSQRRVAQRTWDCRWTQLTATDCTAAVLWTTKIRRANWVCSSTNRSRRSWENIIPQDLWDKEMQRSANLVWNSPRSGYVVPGPPIKSTSTKLWRREDSLRKIPLLLGCMGFYDLPNEPLLFRWTTKKRYVANSVCFCYTYT